MLTTFCRFWRGSLIDKSDPLRDYSRSRTVLMGTWEYDNLPHVPAARNSLNRMQSMLTGPYCGWPKSRVLVLRNERDPGNLPDRLITAFEDAEDIAIFYYVGHGQVDIEDQLCLGLTRSRTESNRRAATSLLFQSVRRALRDSKASMKIVILDCCFAGLAGLPDSTLGSVTGTVLDKTAGTGAYTMAATSAYATAWYEDDGSLPKPQTYFTKYLVDLVESGIPGERSNLRIHSIFSTLSENLARDHRPVPQARSIDAARDFIFARNAAPENTHRDPELEIQRLSAQLATERMKAQEAEARRSAAEAQADVSGRHRRPNPVAGSRVENPQLVPVAETPLRDRAVETGSSPQPVLSRTWARIALGSVGVAALAGIIVPIALLGSHNSTDGHQSTKSPAARPTGISSPNSVSESSASTDTSIIPLPKQAYYPAFSPTGVAFNSSGTKISVSAAGLKDHGTTYLWNARSKSLIASLPSPGSREVDSVTFAPNSNTIASAGQWGVYLWDADTRKESEYLHDPDGSASYTAAFAPSGKTIAVGDVNGYVYLWDIATRKILKSRSLAKSEGGGVSFAGAIIQMAFNKSGSLVFFIDGDNNVYSWNITNNQISKIYSFYGGGAETLTYSSNGADSFSRQVLAFGNEINDQVVLLDGSSYGEITALSSPDSTPGSQTPFAAFSPNGQILAVGDGRYVYLWNLLTTKIIATFPLSAHVSAGPVAFSPDGKTLAVDCSNASIALLNTSRYVPIRTG